MNTTTPTRAPLKDFVSAGYIEIAKNVYARRNGSGIDYVFAEGADVCAIGYTHPAMQTINYSVLEFLLKQAEGGAA